jgi:hypothetical protein
MKNTTHTDSFLATVTDQWGHRLGQMPRKQRPSQTVNRSTGHVTSPASAPVIDVYGDTEHQRMQKTIDFEPPRDSKPSGGSAPFKWSVKHLRRQPSATVHSGELW